MKTVLIVEDEKMIRQGIRTMIQRCDVPVETILECNNGEKALEVLAQEDVEVMFTDIRMPKMNGIELVQRVQQMEKKPIMVAISGYADFNYAVEMLKSGVREYLLKPIEREKLQELLRLLEKEIQERSNNEQEDRQLGYQQLKYILLNDQSSENEIEVLEQRYGEDFELQNYVLCVAPAHENMEEEENVIYLDNIEGNDIYLLNEQQLSELKERDEFYVGASCVHSGVGELRNAYKEALFARKKAFCTNTHLICFGEDKDKKIPDAMLKEAEKMAEAEQRMQRVQLLGTDKTEELVKQFNRFFEAVKKGWMKPAIFAECMDSFFSETAKTYKNTLSDEQEKPDRLKQYYGFECIDEYETEFMEWLFLLHQKMNEEFGGSKNQHKIKMAMEYIQQNYNKELNMAIVSNYISMNYSLFSYLFKEYTGSNFVNYLKTIRMEEAKKLLTETDMKVIEISQTVGYDNEKHFMKVFKATCGVSPSEYRKNTSSFT